MKMNNVDEKKVSEMSAADNVGCLSLMIGFVAYVLVLWFSVPKQSPKHVSTVALLLCYAVAYICVKKHRQKTRPTETIFTEEKRAEWLKNRKSGLIKYILFWVVRFAGALTLVISLIGVLGVYANGDILLFHRIVNGASSIFAYFFAFAVGSAVFTWWDNTDSEAEWQQKKTRP